MLGPSVLISSTIAHAHRAGSTEHQPSTRPYNGRLSSLQHPQASHKQPISASQGDPMRCCGRRLYCLVIVNTYLSFPKRFSAVGCCSPLTSYISRPHFTSSRLPLVLFLLQFPSNLLLFFFVHTAKLVLFLTCFFYFITFTSAVYS